MSFENFLPERDGAVAVPRINRAHRLDAQDPILRGSSRVARAAPRGLPLPSKMPGILAKLRLNPSRTAMNGFASLVTALVVPRPRILGICKGGATTRGGMPRPGVM